MSALFGMLRRAALTPSFASVSFAGRGFDVMPTAETARLEAIPQAVVIGFEWGIETRTTAEIERRLASVEPELRGFAYEGATMALTVRDSVHGHLARDLMLGPGRPHIFLTYIGIGFAMARLPRPLWSKVLPDLGDIPFHPTMSWLAVDGYGFDRAYFETDRWVTRQRLPKPYPWQGDPAYFLRAVDQGIGRALWFIHGGVAPAAAAAVDRFAEHRRADLWSGLGLAASFAGGTGPDGFAELADAAGRHRAELALGAVFAAKARDYAGHVPEHTGTAVRVFTTLAVKDAVQLADGTEVDPAGDGPVPRYEVWRERIRARLREVVPVPPDVVRRASTATAPGQVPPRRHLLGRARRWLLTPDRSQTKLATRGFYEKDPQARELLEQIGATFLTGYAYAAEASRPLDAEVRLEQVPYAMRGFAYEGAAMAFAVRDGLPVGGRRHVEQALAGRASDHVYMVYVGVGWAMARVPRLRWSSLHAPDPLLRWLALDGYGFHQAYFHTDRYVTGQYQEPNFPWPGGRCSWYANNVIDQGIGRALWFVAGTDAALVTDTIDEFPQVRRSDLYAGVGLAATYAGGADEDELTWLWDRAGKYRRHLAQGSAFAAAARTRAALVTEHTVLATRVMCGLSPQAAAELCQEVRPTPVDGDVPAYEVWRNRICDRLAGHAER